MFNDTFSSATLTDCTFTENLASISGGGMENSLESNPALTNCTLCGNSIDQIHGPWDDDGSNCVRDSCEDCVPCPTDLDHNGITDGGDVGVFFIFWGECPVDGCPADFNDDGVVNGTDLGILFSAWGPCQ
jgi:hypothetical protein